MTKGAFTAKVTSKRRITLPQDLCDRLGLRAGDSLTFVEDGASIHVEKADNGRNDAVPVERPLNEVLDEWRERVRPRLKELGWEGMTSDEIFEEMRGRKINTVPGDEFGDEADTP